MKLREKWNKYGALALCVFVLAGSLIPTMNADAAEKITRNKKFTTVAQMQKKTKSKAADDWLPKYLTKIEGYYWNFASASERKTTKISMNLASNAYQNLEMFLDNGYEMDYNKLKSYCEDYKERAGREDAYYLILTDCLNNPYLINKPKATVTDTTYNGRDYSKVFDAQYYYDNNADLQKTIGNDPAELLRHFVEVGINEGRAGNATFSITQYVKETDKEVKKQFEETLGTDAADALGKYSYSYANYYGKYLDHYNYESLFTEEDMAEEY